MPPLPGRTPSSHPLTKPTRGSSSLLSLRVRRRGELEPQPGGTESPVSGEPDTPSPKGVSREVTNPRGPSARQGEAGLGWRDLNIPPPAPRFGGFEDGRFGP